MPARRVRCRSTAGFSIHFIATRLLQITVISSVKVNHSAPAACDECSGSSHHELVVPRPCSIVKPALMQLHWLPVEQRITYKLCLFMHHIHTGQAPQSMSDCASAVFALSGRNRLRSTGSADYVLPRTRTRFGERGFSYCSPAARDILPSDLHDTDTGTFRQEAQLSPRDRAMSRVS